MIATRSVPTTYVRVPSRVNGPGFGARTVRGSSEDGVGSPRCLPALLGKLLRELVGDEREGLLIVARECRGLMAVNVDLAVDQIPRPDQHHELGLHTGTAGKGVGEGI